MLEKLQGVILYANLNIILVFWILKPFIHSYVYNETQIQKVWCISKAFEKTF